MVLPVALLKETAFNLLCLNHVILLHSYLFILYIVYIVAHFDNILHFLKVVLICIV